MNKPFLLFSQSVLFALFLAACAYNTRDEAPAPNPGSGGSACDTTKKYRLGQILPILEEKNCTGCHGNGVTIPDLSDSTKIRAYINSNKSKFITSIRFEGDHPMPKFGTEMADSLQKKIEAWICQGMK